MCRYADVQICKYADEGKEVRSLKEKSLGPCDSFPEGRDGRGKRDVKTKQ